MRYAVLLFVGNPNLLQSLEFCAVKFVSKQTISKSAMNTVQPDRLILLRYLSLVSVIRAVFESVLRLELLFSST